MIPPAESGIFRRMLTPFDPSPRSFRFAAALTDALALALVVLLFVIFFAATSAFAQDGGTPGLVDDPVKAVTGAIEAGSKGQWWGVAAAVVSILTWALRAGVLKRLPKTGALAFLGRAGDWLTTNPIAGFVTPFALSGVLAFVTTFANGTPFTVQTFLQEVLKIGAGAVAVFIGVEKIKEAKNAGALAAAGVTTQQEALDELSKRVIRGGP